MAKKSPKPLTKKEQQSLERLVKYIERAGKMTGSETVEELSGLSQLAAIIAADGRSFVPQAVSSLAILMALHLKMDHGFRLKKSKKKKGA